jgi:glycosyltransferase involved in cell wall biosynthesis
VKDNPDVTFVVFGHLFNWMKDLPNIEHHDWVDYAAYKTYRKCLDVDINLAPLVPGTFNECKSAIRWYDASLGKNPEATLAANVGPYKEIEDGKTGLLYDTPEEFAENLQLLIDNESNIRQRLGQAARRWVLQNRAAEKTVPGLFEWFKEIKAKQRMDNLART